VVDEGAPRARVLAVEAVVVGLVAVGIAAVLFSVWRAHWEEPFSYDGDALYYAMVGKTIARYGTYLHNPHLGWPFGQNLADYPEGGDNLNWFSLAATQLVTGSTWTAMNVLYMASFGAVAATAHVVLRLLGVRRILAAAVALLFAFVPYHFARAEAHFNLSAYFMVPFAVLIALMLLSDDPPVTRRTESGRWRLDWRSRRTWLVLLAAALLASTGAYYFVFAMLLFLVAAVVNALSGGGWRPIVAGGVIMAVSIGVFAVNVSPSILEIIRHGTAPGAVVRTPMETELYGLRISQLYAPRQDHRIGALATLADDSQGNIVPSERGQQLGLIGAVGLTIILAVFVLSAVVRRRTGWWGSRLARLLVGLGLLAGACMVVGAISSYSLLFSAAGLRNIRAWNRISIVIAFCALAGVALLADRLATRLSRRRPRAAPFIAAGLGAVLLAVGLFDQTSPADRPDYADVHRRYSSDEAFFQAVADRLPPGTAVFELPHVPFPEVPPIEATQAYDQARGFVFQPQLAWSYGFMRGRHPEYPLAFKNESTDDWMTALASIGFRGLVIDRFGYPDEAAQLQSDVTKLVGGPPLVSEDGRYAFFDLTAYDDQVRTRIGDVAMAALGREALQLGPLKKNTKAPAPPGR
jgi:phosphoglycerol transferase